MKTGDKIMSVVVFLMFLMIACVGGYVYISEIKDIQNSEPHTVTIHNSEVEKRISYESTGGGPEKKVTRYFAYVEYSYTYNGSFYENDRVFPGSADKSLSKQRAEKIVSNYSEGRTTQAYVDPEKPESSYLIEESSRDDLTPVLTAGFVFTIFIIAILIVSSKYKELMN